ncbi:MAG: PaaI family thioesterase [Actinomycetota bacterium]|nr:PaaI family thioesterase [Actinomycetota bacterium]
MSDFRDIVGLTERPAGEGHDAVLTLRVEGRHLNAMGAVHGGVIATLVDSAMANAVSAALGEGRRGVTVALNVTYLEGAAQGDELDAVAQVRRAGGRIVVVEADVTRSGDGAAIAHAVATFAPQRHD